MSADDPETSDWTDATVLKLLVAMKRSIPEDERHLSFYAGMRHMDWKTVAFPPFSPEACQQKWSEILAKIRKTRTFGELMDEAEDVISKTEKYQLSLEENNRKMPESRKQSQKPSKDRKRKRKSDITLSPDEFPGEPKMPTQSACVVFREEQMILLCKKVPSKKERFMKIDKMWKDLSDAEKEPYKEKMQENVMKYSMELQEWFKTLTAAVQEDYLTCKPSKREFLDGKTVARSKVSRKMNFALLSDSDSSSDDDD
ncbi:nucleolar transcription factor 1-like [Larimichthys crocea]|uniref:nucleolar transcription factor 1-like n=1 Tax=Larimichthys crocea TaxID=215358 RepID=UPI000F5EC800|nr:nucleolar transcription factor 1-like [Larimichthys crocea]